MKSFKLYTFLPLTVNRSAFNFKAKIINIEDVEILITI